MNQLPTFYLTHGGGPWPFMDNHPFKQAFAQLGQCLTELPQRLATQPKAILVVSGHWEAPAFTVSTAKRPGMLYDYYGFPEHTYHVKYPAPGAPKLAKQVVNRLKQAGFNTATDNQRGYDHGTFCLLQLLYPQANIPVLQLSLQHALDPEQHLKMGQQLAELRNEGILIIGSGSSYHNLRHFDASGALASRQFDQWLQQTLTDSTPAARWQQLVNWQQAPAAREAHPREEHLLPLMATVGAAAEEPGYCIFRQTDLLGGLTISCFQFGE